MSVTGGIMAGVGLASAGISAGTSLSAAGTQADAAKSAAELSHEDQQAALAFQEQQWNTTQANQAPWVKAGQTAIGDLSTLLGPGGSLSQPWTQTFTPPTLADAQNEPGYQFSEQQGEQALQNAASAQGELLDPNAARAEVGYAQTSAETNYQNVYNRSFQQYQQGYNQFKQNQADQYNRLAGVAGIGQVSANQLGQTGQAASNNVGNIMLTGAAQQGQQFNNAAAATASGYVGTGNAASGALNNVGSSLMLSQLLNPTGPQTTYNPNIWMDSGQSFLPPAAPVAPSLSSVGLG